MGWEFVTVERRGRVAILRFDRGDGLNPMSLQLIRELEHQLSVITGLDACSLQPAWVARQSLRCGSPKFHPTPVSMKSRMMTATRFDG